MGKVSRLGGSLSSSNTGGGPPALSRGSGSSSSSDDDGNGEGILTLVSVVALSGFLFVKSCGCFHTKTDAEILEEVRVKTQQTEPPASLPNKLTKKQEDLLEEGGGEALEWFLEKKDTVKRAPR